MEEELAKLYESVRMLDELGIPISQAQMRAIKEVEGRVLESQLFPKLKKLVEEETTDIKGEFQLAITKNSAGFVEIKPLSEAEVEPVDESIIFGNFTFDYAEQKLIHPKATRTLTRKECDLLKLLLEYKNKLLPREVILREVWGTDDKTTSRSMDVYMTKLRGYLQVDCAEKVKPKGQGQRKVIYEAGYEPDVEIRSIHGAGFTLKVSKD